MYVAYAFGDHLSNKKVYKELTKLQAIIRANNTIDSINYLLNKYKDSFTNAKKKCILSFTKKKSQDIKSPHFYHIFKVHKDPLTSRPIISISGCYLQGLSIWVDNQLKPIIIKLQSYINSLRNFKNQLPKNVDKNHALLFTPDATSMCTNIDIKHALLVIEEFLSEHPLCIDLDWKPII